MLYVLAIIIINISEHIYFKDNLKEVCEDLKGKFQQTASFHSIMEAWLNTGTNINKCYFIVMVTAIYLIAKIKEKFHLLL